jgi:hypothetical protein
MGESDEQGTALGQVLGQVLGELDGSRGADGLLSVTVLPLWLESGARLLVRRPRKLVCAACEGGGCDACERSGALVLPSAEDADEEILEVSLPQVDPARPVVLRIPGRGMPSLNTHEPAGHLLLRVAPGAQPSTSVTLDRGEASRNLAHLDRSLVTRSTVMAVFLIALFLGLLRLSGWM